jgi:hypothetical protein
MVVEIRGAILFQQGKSDFVPLIGILVEHISDHTEIQQVNHS